MERFISLEKPPGVSYHFLSDKDRCDQASEIHFQFLSLKISQNPLAPKPDTQTPQLG